MSVGISPGQDADGWWLDAVPDLVPQGDVAIPGGAVDDAQNLDAVPVPERSDRGGGGVADVTPSNAGGFASGFPTGAGSEDEDKPACPCAACAAAAAIVAIP